MEKAEEIYEKDFYTKFASSGTENITHRQKVCGHVDPDEYMDIFHS